MVGVLEKGQCLQDNIQYYGDCSSTRYSYTDNKNSYWGDVEIVKTTNYRYMQFCLYLVQPAMSSFVIICNKDMQTVPNMYIINLATSDIIYLTVFFAEACANRISDTWLQGDFMCMFIPFCRRLSVGLSVHSVAVLSIQRYTVTVNPLQFRLSSPPT